ncbi:hypothetical protein [Halotalea alkalilenta]|uniref:hypothetical protein n=1 Tax=Halotalea alkalilenta TaxID=376489 RepID=UPI0004883D5E|nr:hypothetical protein [Halotalea alkalilenta]
MAGIVDDGVDAAEARQSGLHGQLRLGLIGDVKRRHQHAIVVEWRAAIQALRTAHGSDHAVAMSYTYGASRLLLTVIEVPTITEMPGAIVFRH